MNKKTNSEVLDVLNRAPVDDEPESAEEKRASTPRDCGCNGMAAEGYPCGSHAAGLGQDDGAESLRSALLACPIEEDEITAETAAALDRASESLARGEGIAHEEIVREFKVAEEPDRPY